MEIKNQTTLVSTTYFGQPTKFVIMDPKKNDNKHLSKWTSMA